jgi:hypothetical protein
MGTGYTRNDTVNNIADGNIINASDIDGEYDALQAAFDAATGHTHDGTTGEGAPIEVTGPAQEYVSTGTEFRPKANNTYDLGSSGNQWKDLYVDGTANLDAVDIDGGNIDGTVIGAASAAAGTFTTATATTGNITTVNATTVDTTNIEVTNIKAKDGTAAGSIADATGVVTLASSVLTTTDINGGTIDGTTIGGASAAAGTFTNVTANGTINLAGATVSNGGTVTTVDINGGTIDGTVIGGSTPAAISGTTGSFSGDVSIADKIVHTGDTNTAIRFPAADTVTVETAGSEKMRITSTGSVGIGTSSPASKFVVSGGRTDLTANSETYALGVRYSSGTGIYYIGASNSATPDLVFSQVGGSERVRFTNDGNVGIGTSSPAQKLVTQAASGNLEILNTVRNDNTGAGVAAIGFNVSSNTEGDFTQAGIGFVRGIANGGGALAFYNKSDGATGNFTTANERMRVDSGGNFIIGGTSSSARFAVLSAQGGNFANRQIYIEDTTAITSQPGIGFHASANSSAGIIKFYGPSNQFEIRNSNDSGFIAILASAFVPSSDYRIKSDVQEVPSLLSKIMALRPVHYEKEGLEGREYGFIAHELSEHLPDLVRGQKDGVRGDGSMELQTVHYMALTAVLVKAMQEQQGQIEKLKTEMAALNGSS